jgi:hypothetical protein
LGLDRSLEIELTTAMVDVSLLWAVEDRDRPNKPVFTKRFRRLRGAFVHELLGWHLSLRLTRDTTRYPNDTRKDKRVREVVIKAERSLAPFTLSASFEHEETVFPNNPVKDKLFRKGAVAAEWTRDPVSLTVALEARDTHFPNDPVKEVRQIDAGFELEVKPSEAVNVTLEGEWIRKRFPNDPEKNRMTTSLALEVTVYF